MTDSNYYPNNDTEEFCGILKCLDDIELAILHQALLQNRKDVYLIRYGRIINHKMVK